MKVRTWKGKQQILKGTMWWGLESLLEAAWLRQLELEEEVETSY